MEYEAYEDSLKAYRDWKNMIDTAMMIAKKEGHEEGRQEGREIGRQEGRKEGLKEGLKEKAIETARRMKTKGYPIEEIMLLTDLSEEEITQLL